MRGAEGLLSYLSFARDLFPAPVVPSTPPPAGRGRKVKGKRHASQHERANRRKAKTKRKCHGRSR